MIRVASEIGPLRRVLLQRPGQEIEWMAPSMMEELLFDDILDGEDAVSEHDGFRGLLESAGVEVLDARRCLAEVLAEDGARQELFRELRGAYLDSDSLLARLSQLEAGELAEVMVSGMRTAADAETSGGFYELPPLPNYFFQRDPQIVLGDQVVISSMATDARQRETLLALILFRHHPALQGYRQLYQVGRQSRGVPRENRNIIQPTLEGGDVLVAGPDTLLVGTSERTNQRGVVDFAEHLRQQEAGYRNLILVSLPAQRAYMHLDTVFTFVDRNACLAYRPVIAGDGPEAAAVYHVDLTAPSISFRLRSSLLSCLAELGIELELIPCGGDGDLLFEQREQWTDGANAFAVAPGVIFLYRRNRRTVEALARRGWRVLREEDVLAGREEILGHGPTVVTLLGYELSRARGGPRCMTMPLERDPL